METPLQKSKSTEEYFSTKTTPTLFHSASAEYFNFNKTFAAVTGMKKLFTKAWLPTKESRALSAKIMDLNPQHAMGIVNGYVVDWNTGTSRFDLGPSCAIASFSQRDNMIATYHTDESVLRLTNADTFHPVHEFKSKPLKTILFPNAQRIIMVPKDSGTIYFTRSDAEQKNFISQTLVESGEIDLTDIIDDGSLAHTSFLDNKPIAIYLTDLEKEKIIAELLGHTSTITKLDHTQSTIGSSSQDKTFRLWNPTLSKNHCLISREHAAPITALAIHPKENYISAGTSIPDGKIYVWDRRKMSEATSITKLPSALEPSARIKNLYETNEIYPSIVYLAHDATGSSIVAQTKWYDQDAYQTYEGKFLELLAGKSLEEKSLKTVNKFLE